jgi:hypothetical protein
MHTVVTEVTPQLAAEWLSSNTFNRTISTPLVKKYANDMAAGFWTLNHQGIAFDDSGTLVDGQHRLSAVVMSGVTIKIMVTYGSSRVGIDELRVRHAADVIKFGGLSDWVQKKEIEVAKTMHVIWRGSSGHNAMSNSALVQFCEQHREAIMWNCAQFRAHNRGISSALVRGVFAVAYYHYDKKTLENCIESLYSGVIENVNHNAIIRARDMILGEKATGGADRMSMAKRLSRAIDAYCNEKPLSRLMVPEKIAFDLPERN